MCCPRLGAGPAPPRGHAHEPHRLLGRHDPAEARLVDRLENGARRGQGCGRVLDLGRRHAGGRQGRHRLGGGAGAGPRLDRGTQGRFVLEAQRIRGKARIVDQVGPADDAGENS